MVKSEAKLIEKLWYMREIIALDRRCPVNRPMQPRVPCHLPSAVVGCRGAECRVPSAGAAARQADSTSAARILFLRLYPVSAGSIVFFLKKYINDLHKLQRLIIF